MEVNDNQLVATGCAAVVGVVLLNLGLLALVVGTIVLVLRFLGVM